MDTSVKFVRGNRGRSGWIAILALALISAALQAKLGLYHPQQSQAHLISKVFKVSECRWERFVADPPVAIVNVVIADGASEAWHPEPDLPEYTPSQPRPLLISCSHWFRPPPARS